ncbi:MULTISPECIES: flagellin [Cryobacterium]|uniref:Flagellin n=1 Tax=Cryobacterium levicorallinum TaxID=995038 RepID=A0A1I3BRZ9_9MICO|nr:MULTISPECIES: flagellin [Cryobacterium]TFB81330.1 flagellin [Cryobacterium levicorallinum]TFD61172.1 flagellin [Cryobacterium sp. Hh38]GEP28334.1 flagellin [Cryobacterium levicorallinum]SFH65065.1 flagellin [Cryobacterium levicorallinum]
MGMQVNTNIAANNAYRNLATTQNDLSKSLEKLSSGLRINRAADDAAGLAISEGLKSQVGGLTVASRNAQDAISVIQTAEGSLNEVTSILQRMRDLAVQAGNDSNNEQSRDAITTEATALTKELTRIAAATNFNGTDLLKGGSMSFQIGANANDTIGVGLANIGTLAANLTTAPSSVNYALVDADADTIAGAQSFSIENSDGTITSIETDVFVAGSVQTVSQFAAALNADGQFKNNLYASVSSTNVLNIKTLDGGTLDPALSSAGVTGTGAGTTVDPVVGASALDFSDAAGATAAIATITAQIVTVSTARADLGANQNRFESVIKNLAVSKENLTAAGSRIRDTDMAEEMVKYTRANILSQAGTAMLAQANQSNSGVLQLLQ